MSKHDELRSLEQKAVAIAAITDRKKRQRGGMYLENECRKLDDQYRIIGGLDRNAEIRLRAVLQIVFDYILYDALEDEDWAMAMPDRFEGDVSEILGEA